MSGALLVSVVVPAYKTAFLEAALASAFAQTYRPLELVVSDNCPAEAVRELCLLRPSVSPGRLAGARRPHRGLTAAGAGGGRRDRSPRPALDSGTPARRRMTPTPGYP